MYEISMVEQLIVIGFGLAMAIGFFAGRKTLLLPFIKPYAITHKFKD